MSPGCSVGTSWWMIQPRKSSPLIAPSTTKGAVSPVVATLDGEPLRSAAEVDRGACSGTVVHAPDGLYVSPTAPSPAPRATFGVADDVPLMDWLQNHIWPAEGKHVSDEFVYDGALLAMGEMFRSGTTTINDMYFFPTAMARAAVDSGVRAAVSMNVIDFPTGYASGPDDYIAKGVAAYEQFKSDFGVEEIVLIAIERQLADDELLEAVCGRVERLPGVRKCMSPDRLRSVMGETGVSSDQAVNRLKGLALSGDEKLAGLIVLLSDSGLKDRAGTVADINRELQYCRLHEERSFLSGGPVIVAELDRLGGSKENQKFFLVTLVICLGLLYYWIKDWKLSLSVLGLTLWAINLTMTIFKLAGGEMNFILGALAVMVMVDVTAAERLLDDEPSLTTQLIVRLLEVMVGFSDVETYVTLRRAVW